MYKDKKESIEQMLVVSKGNQCYKGKLNSNALCQTLLLVRNKRTNKVNYKNSLVLGSLFLTKGAGIY